MYLSHFKIISTIYLVHRLLFAGAGDLPVQYDPVDDIAVNCGSAGVSYALDGREWIGDIGSKFTSPKEAVSSSTIVHQSPFADHVPYMTAQISRAQFTYTFQLRPGQKFIRLHFFPASYPGFERTKAFFTVKAGPYTLLSNFSTSLAADILGVRYFTKEFCVNIEKNQVFSITFSPSKSSATDDVYAFINGIEIVSMPAGLYYTPDGDLGAHVIGNKFRFYIDNNTALEMIHRLNVGGRSILSVEDLGMFRVWSEDKNYLLESSFLRVSTSNLITYTNIPTYSAPLKVYQTAWSIGSNQHTNQAYRLTWKFPVDLGFRYLVRLHFCELEPTITEGSQKWFDLMINNKVIEADADVIKWSGGNGVAVYKDYVVMMEGDRMERRRDLIIALQLKYESSTETFDAILKGIEIFKLSNPDNNLAGVNHVFRAHVPISSRTPRLQKLLLAFGSINTIATCIIIVLTLLNFIVYHLNCLESNSSKINNSSSLDGEELQRRFSLVEIELATHNFDDELVIGKGGFGNVYKGLINRSRTVAIKRLNSQSKQGANEFWAEINSLSKLRHNHLVSLIGYCDDCQEMILVYEYMVHGTLADHLHKGRKGNSPLSWERRLNICIGAARGLEFLHVGSKTHHGIIHRDVKSSNILLDENWVAKISDFGLSKMDTANISRTHISTNVKGTIGYLDPEYAFTERLTKRSDVYGFGVVLFEVLCGRRAVDLTLEDEEQSLAPWARKCIQRGTIDQLIDPSVKEQISSHCLRGFGKLANKCLHHQPNKRPTMAEIVATLIKLELQGRADSEGTCIKQEDIDVGESSMTHTEGSIMSDGSPSTSGHYSITPIDVINENKELQSMSPGTTNNMEFQTKEEDYGSNKGPTWGQLWSSFWNRKRLPKTKGNYPLAQVHCRRFSLPDIRAATNNFDDCLLMKNDDCVKVYKGYIQKIGKVTIERYLNRNNYHMIRSELVQSQLRCINVVALVGYCYDGFEMILVYEYMANETLSDRLHNIINNPLSWKQRLQICIGAARGLNYLHTGVVQTNIHGGVTKIVERTIIHRDVKPSNIFLDQNWVAKIAGFGLSLLVPKHQMFITTKVAGTPGYVDPEYLLTSLFSLKSDVYSFGVVLLEVLCARKAVSMEIGNEWRILSKWALEYIEAGSVQQIIDPYLIGNMSTPSLNVFVEVARKCLLPKGTERPSMTDVVRTLELALELQETVDVALENGDMELSGPR